MSRSTSVREDEALRLWLADEFLRVDAGAMLEYIAATFEPSEVFPEGELATWAEDNGWTKGGAA